MRLSIVANTGQSAVLDWSLQGRLLAVPLNPQLINDFRLVSFPNIWPAWQFMPFTVITFLMLYVAVVWDAL